MGGGYRALDVERGRVLGGMGCSAVAGIWNLESVCRHELEQSLLGRIPCRKGDLGRYTGGVQVSENTRDVRYNTTCRRKHACISTTSLVTC